MKEFTLVHRILEDTTEDQFQSCITKRLSEKFISRRICPCSNSIEVIYTNLDGTVPQQTLLGNATLIHTQFQLYIQGFVLSEVSVIHWGSWNIPPEDKQSTVVHRNLYQ